MALSMRSTKTDGPALRRPLPTTADLLEEWYLPPEPAGCLHARTVDAGRLVSLRLAAVLAELDQARARQHAAAANVSGAAMAGDVDGIAEAAADAAMLAPAIASLEAETAALSMAHRQLTAHAMNLAAYAHKGEGYSDPTFAAWQAHCEAVRIRWREANRLNNATGHNASSDGYAQAQAARLQSLRGLATELAEELDAVTVS